MNEPVKSSLIEKGMQAGEVDMYDEDSIWSDCSSDKVDIADRLMQVIRDLYRSVSPDRQLRALSIGSGSEPQFQILQAAFRGKLCLLDIDSVPLSIINNRVKKRWINNVKTILADYTKTLVRIEDTGKFFRDVLDGSRQDLVTLHHSLYYSRESDWSSLFHNLKDIILAEKGAIHAVLMSPSSREKDSTTWLYNHFAGKFFGCRNDQDLAAFGRSLCSCPGFEDLEIETHRVKFFVDDFEKFMAVIWMILLYPDVHDYSQDQKEEITEYVYDNFFKSRKPLVQMQDHLLVRKI